MRIALLLTSVGAAALAACSPYAPDLSYSPFLCGSGSSACPDGFTCTGMDQNGEKTCISTSAKLPDGGGSGSNGMCANDSAVEMAGGQQNNDTVATAYTLPDPLPNNGVIKLSALAICPMGDVDNYSLIVAANHEIKAELTYETWGAPLSGSILSSTGSPLTQMGPESGMDRTLVADLPNTMQGLYVIKVFGPSSPPAENNYELTITVTPYP